MTPVVLAIRDIVDEIDDTGERAEDDEGRRCSRDGLWIGEAEAEDEPREDQEVLGPLAGSEREE